jgi:hypothetical protein
MAMGIMMTLHIKPYYFLINIDMKSAYNSMWRAAIMEIEAQRTHDAAQDNPILESEARAQVSHMGRGRYPMGRRWTTKGFAVIKSPAFAFTIQPWVPVAG